MRWKPQTLMLFEQKNKETLDSGEKLKKGVYLLSQDWEGARHRVMMRVKTVAVERTEMHFTVTGTFVSSPDPQWIGMDTQWRFEVPPYVGWGPKLIKLQSKMG